MNGIQKYSLSDWDGENPAYPKRVIAKLNVHIFTEMKSGRVLNFLRGELLR